MSLEGPATKGKWGKAQKRAYAKEKAAEELIAPPKNPPAAWLSDPSLLPKRPPARVKKDDDE